jgi:hypothetical protein
MRVRAGWMAAVGLCALVTTGIGEASAQVGVTQSNQKKTIACGGQDAAVTGSLNDIIFTGDCPSVTIKGSENTISIEATGQIRVVGTKNKVTWQRVIGDDKTPRVSSSGLGNVITRATPPAREDATASGAAGAGAGVGAGTASSAGKAPSAGAGAAPAAGKAPSAGAGAASAAGKASSAGAGAGKAAGSASGATAPAGSGSGKGSTAGKASAGPAVVVADEKATKTIDCRGRGVTVMGNGNTLTLRGTCGKIDVQGNENKISVDTVQTIATTGNNNRVTWSRAAEGELPQTSDLGNGNVIRRGTAPLP